MDKSIEKLQSILEKSKNPIESLKIEVELFGIFNLPESWKPVEGETIEFTHSLNIAKVQFLNGKVRRRELTEEEHKALEESKKLKKEAPKKKGQDNELTPEEVILAEKRKKFQEEQRKRREEELERADEEGKYHLNMEDIYKNPCITWENDTVVEDFRLVKSYSLGVEKKPSEIVEFEEAVEDVGGFDRTPGISKAERRDK